uniref:P-type domain-containing protein n=1 Tax=Parascaris equorum TaxID=6256 RepID=A0A914S6U9_PAREQ
MDAQKVHCWNCGKFMHPTYRVTFSSKLMNGWHTRNRGFCLWVGEMAVIFKTQSINSGIVWPFYYALGNPQQYVDPDKRIDCFPAPGTTQLASHCARAGCIYDQRPEFGIPACYFPRRSGYIIKNTTTDGVVLERYPGVANPYGDNISPIFFNYSQIGSTVNIRIAAKSSIIMQRNMLSKLNSIYAILVFIEDENRSRGALLPHRLVEILNTVMRH